MRVLFATASRLPTERANGYCAVKTCEGLADAGAEVELWYPNRLQADPELQHRDPLDYYGIRNRFATRKVGEISPFYEGRLSDQVGPLLTRAQFSVWAAKAARLARSSNPDVCYTIETEVALAMTLVGIPVIYENHHPKGRGFAKQTLRFVARRAANPGIVALSTRLQSELVSFGVPARKVCVIRHAVEPDFYRNLPSRSEARELLGLAVDRPVVGYVGRFHALGLEKGIGTLIEAMGLVQTVAGSRPLLVCVGGPASAEGAYADFAARCGIARDDISFVGEVRNDEVPMWIRAFDVATIPFPASHHFATVSPIKLVEYLASGACVLATDLASIREEVVHDVNAWLVPPNASGIAQGLDRLLNDHALRDRLGSAAGAALANRTWRRRGEEILTFIEMRPQARAAEYQR